MADDSNFSVFFPNTVSAEKVECEYGLYTIDFNICVK